MKKVLWCILLWSCQARQEEVFVFKDFDVRVLADHLSNPWELSYGPDHYLWLTASRSYEVLRIDPVTGRKEVLADLSRERNFPRYDKIDDEQDGGKPWPQGGLMGMALHPLLLKGKPYVYLHYIHKFEGAEAKGNGKSAGQGFKFLSRIVRYVYDRQDRKLIDPVVLCDTIPSSNDHTGGRLLIADCKGKPYLFCSVGDMGAGQFANAQRPNKAQRMESYEGKILRFNLEADPHLQGSDQWIPDDNPFNGRRKNAVWTMGHRNAQGLAALNIAGKTRIYACEHGPYSDDELNVIEKGCNYGHPLIVGYADGNYNGMKAFFSNNKTYGWSSLPLIKDERSNAIALGENYRDPLKSFPLGHPAELAGLCAHIRLGKRVQEGISEQRASWKAYAPSSLEVYTADAIPGWKNSILMTTLKGGRLLRLKLDDKGELLDGKFSEYAKSDARYRDLAVSNDGLKLYLALDSIAVTSEPSKYFMEGKHCKGCILELRYKGATTVSR
ncbi:PQQ-dependent sugar dehydrogenase [Pedobacter sp. MC2016-14]|uniref:PQQ-dependent sugar dehydrogenase n=1 Tax=Pedobacter sp. MC2016-14 TaxID=2897327 RepID=UPI001E45CFAB|nr:PQQ-dependent sugar dehydrogenase [Pedobacter sp. MC2016-14]